jgi:hypothetical protein
VAKIPADVGPWRRVQSCPSFRSNVFYAFNDDVCVAGAIERLIPSYVGFLIEKRILIPFVDSDTDQVVYVGTRSLGKQLFFHEGFIGSHYF